MSFEKLLIPLAATMLLSGCESVPSVVCEFTLPELGGATRVASGGGFNLMVSVKGDYTADELPVVRFSSDVEGVLLESGIAVTEDGCLAEGCVAGGRVEDPIQPGEHVISAVALTPQSNEACRAEITVRANTPPEILSAELSPTPIRTADDVSFTFDIRDEDGDWPSLVNVSTRWVGPEGQNLSGETLSHSQTAAGQTWKLELQARDAHDTGAAFVVDVPIENTAPGTPAVVVSPQPGRLDAPLRCVVTNASTLDPDVSQQLELSRTWLVDGSDSGESGPELSPGLTAAGQTWTCSVVASDGVADSEPGEASTTVLPDLSVPATLPLASLAAVAGTATSQVAGDRYQISSPGDVDGDGRADFVMTSNDLVIVGASQGPGVAWLFLGADELPATLVGASAGFRAPDGVRLRAPAPVGDLDGDGLDDLVLPFRHALQPTGSTGNGVFIVWGSALGFEPVTQLADAVSAGDATVIYGLGEEIGQIPCAPGDLDGDGLAELALSSPLAEGGTGALHVLYGHARPWQSGGTPQDLNSRFTVVGAEAGDQLGAACAGPLDLNGDGWHDLAVAAPFGGAEGVGQVLILNGGPQRWSGDKDASDADTVIAGPTGSPGGFGLALAALRDHDADGYNDLTISGREIGKEGGLWVHSDGTELATELTASELPFAISGGGELGFCGQLSGADIDGDGLADIACGDVRPDAAVDLSADPAVRVFLGSSTAPTTRLWSDADLSVTGAAGDRVGSELSGLSDRDDNGYDELLIGAAGVDAGGTDSGAAYLLDLSTP